MTARQLAVVTAGLSQPSSTRLLADRLADAAQRALEDRGSTTSVEVIELRDVAQDLTNNLLTGFAAPKLSEAIGAVLNSDGLIAVTPIFTASYSGLFKTFFDVLDADALTGKPVLMAATGGTERHSLALEHALRPMFSYLHAVVVPTAVYAATSDFGGEPRGSGALTARIDRAAGELAGLIAGRPAAGRIDPFADLTPFEDLLIGD